MPDTPKAVRCKINGDKIVDEADRPWGQRDNGDTPAVAVPQENYEKAREAMLLVRSIKEANEGRAATISNQGQAMDGYTELANYRASGSKIIAALALLPEVPNE